MEERHYFNETVMCALLESGYIRKQMEQTPSGLQEYPKFIAKILIEMGGRDL